MRPFTKGGTTGRKAFVAVLSLLFVSSGIYLFFGPGTMSATEDVGDDAVAASTSMVNASSFNRFIANEGQWSSGIGFVATTNFGSAAFASDGFYYYLPAPDNVTEVVSFKFVGSNTVAPSGASKLTSTSNYLIGNDPSSWQVGVPEYGKIVYTDLWDGIDLAFFFVGGELKYELTVAAGVSAEPIAVQVSGAVVEVRDGALIISTASNSIVDGDLVAYYVDDCSAADASFTVRDDTYSFELGRDDSRAVVIDPLVYSTYLGGSNRDECFDIAVDQYGCVYVTGFSTYSGFPVSEGAYQAANKGYRDAFVTKFNADGRLAYSTYLGGGATDIGNGIAVDPAGCAYVIGQTNSGNFPTKGAVQTSFGGGNWDAFITKLDPAGGLAYSTYLGVDSDDRGYSIAVDAYGCAYVTGEAGSGAFPVTEGAFQTTKSNDQDAFVTKLNADGSALVYSTFLGGVNLEKGYGIAVDSTGCAFLIGFTHSTNFPVTAGSVQTSFGGGKCDAFVTKLSADGSALVYSTYLGGSGDEIGFNIALDASGSAHATGHTTSGDFPTYNEVQDSLRGGYDAFVTKLNPAGSALAYSTYLGGNGSEGYTTNDYRFDIAVDPSGFTYVTGFTASTDFPIKTGAYQTALRGYYDAYVAMFDPAGDFVYSTYLGGNGSDYGQAIAIGSYGCAYVTGTSWSSDFPVTDGAYQSAQASGDAGGFVTKLSMVPGPPHSLTAIPGETNVSLTWAAPNKSSTEALDHYTIYQDDVPIAVVTNTAFLAAGLTAGHEYTFSVSAGNALGDGPSATISAMPGIYITVEAVASLQYANASTAGQLVIDVTAESELSSIALLSANVSHYVDGVLIGDEPIAVGSGPYTDAFYPSLAIGVNRYTFTFNDSAGNSISKSVTVVYDVTDPTIDVVSPSDGEISMIDAVRVSWTASDDVSGIAYFDVSIDGGAPFWLSGDVMEYTFDELADGQHVVRIVAVDMAGNEGSDEISFTVDTVAPSLVILAPLDGSYNNTGSVTVRWTAVDDTSDIKKVEYSVDGGPFVDANGAESYLWSGLAGGTYTFYVRAEDNAGHWATDEVSFTVDTVAPAIEIWYPAEGAYLDTSTVTIDWIVDDERSGIVKIEYRVDGGGWTAVAGSNCSLELADGAHTFVLRVTDNAGNVREVTLSFIVDTVAPSVVILAPADGSFNNTSSITACWTASDATSGIAIIRYRIDGMAWTNADEVGSLVWSELADGSHTIDVRAVDRAGNRYTTSASFVVDTVAPSIAIDEPIDGSFNTLDHATVGWTAEDDCAGIAFFEVVVMRDGALSRSFQVPASEGSMLLSDLADGEYVVTVRAIDKANNVKESSVSFIVDTVGPVVSIISPTVEHINTDPVVVEWTASDANGIRIVQYSIDGKTWFDADGATTYEWSGLTDGPHTFYVRAEDNAGNVNEASSTFVSDRAAPAMDIISPNDGSYLSGSTVIVEWTVSDATSGIRTVEYRIDGLGWTAVTGSNCSLVLTDGDHEVLIRATDNAGNVYTASVGFIVDTISPSVVITSPIDGSFNNTGSVAVSWTASDVKSGIRIIQYSTDGMVWFNADGATSYLWSSLVDGAYTFYVRAEDNAGNVAIKEVSFVVDTIAPTIDIISPSNGAYLNTDNVTVSWTASDVNGITAVEYSTDRVNWIATSNSTFVWSGLADGTHIIHIRATDSAGNTATDAVTFVVDTMVPSLDWTPAGSGVLIDGPIIVSFSEPMSKTSVSISVGGITGTVSWSGNVLTFTPSSALAYGSSYTVVVSGKDLAGNELSASWSFITMKDEGTVGGTIVGPDGNPVAGATVTLGNMTATTDGNGRFVLSNVTSGMYDLKVSKDGYEALTESVTVIAGETVEMGTLNVRSTSNIGMLIAAAVAVAAVLAIAAFMLVKRKA